LKQVFKNYTEWEDYLSGMYDVNGIIDKDVKVIHAIQLLNNEIGFYNACKEVVNNWINATAVNLTNNDQNKRAWLGAAACMYKHNCPEYLTRIAWNLLNKENQNKANAVAEHIINEYIKSNNHEKTLFDQ